MPFREQEYSELCAQCRKPAGDYCLRCTKPLCVDHAPGQGRRCDECEEVWAETLSRIERGVLRSAWIKSLHLIGAALVSIGAWVLLLSLVTVFDLPAAVWVAAGGAAFFGVGALWKNQIKAGARRRFLAEQRRHLLTSGDD